MMSTLSARLGDAVAKLVLLPVVGMSLCGAVAIMLGLQWMEVLQRQHQTLRWRARMWATLLKLLPTLLPFKRLEVAVVSAEKSPRSSQVEKGRSEVFTGESKRDAQSQEEDGKADSRPMKLQKAGTGGSEQAESVGLEARQDDEEQAGDEEDEDNANEEAIGEKLKMKSSMKPQVRRRVFIWDLDETLVLFASLYTGTFAQTHGKEVASGVALGEQMMTLLLTILERHFYFSDLHDIDVDHIAHVASTMAENETSCLKQNNVTEHHQPSVQERYERIREIYERRGHVDFLHDANSESFAIRGALIAAIDNFSTGWLNEARQVLELICESAAGSAQPMFGPNTAANYDRIEEEEEVENVNVLVTNTQLVPALCKCLIYQLDSFFPIDRVYSSAKVHKHRCFETILKKYDAPGVEFVAIGDGLEEEHVSLALGLEFHKIRSLVDLKRLRYDLQLVHVNSSSAPPSATAIDSPAVVAAQMSVGSSPVGHTTAF